MASRIVDSHQHFWQVGSFDYPWMSSEVAVLYRDYLPPTLEPILLEHGVAQTVVVQASNSLDETRWMLNLADHYPFIAGVVGWVDLAGDEVEQQLDELTSNRNFKGVRHLVESEPVDDWMVQASVLRNLRVLASYGVSYDLLVQTRHLKYVPKIADSCPELRLVVDHMAKPPVACGEVKQWAAAIREVAAYPTIYCKLSGLVTEADLTSWSMEDLRPFVECAIEFFGTRRLMFGSDYPVCLLAASYGQVLDSFQSLLAGLKEDDQSRIFAANAIEFYRLGEDDMTAIKDD
jgi:L-fuconolactonase